MENAKTVITLAAALFFSLACAVLIEELVFGGLFRLFFAPRPERLGNEPQSGRKF